MKTRLLILTGLFASLTAVGAMITVPLPFSPVPLTLQIFFTLLSGVLLGSRYGALSQVVYLLLGGIGLPIFAGGRAGFQSLVGPSAGYLWGFVFAAYVVGLITEKRSSLAIDFLGMICGLIVIYIPGTLVLHWATNLTLTKAFMVGVVPFIPGDLMKMIIAGMLSERLQKKIPEIRKLRGK